MVLHHIFNEQDLTNFCPYCKKDLSNANWKSSFHGAVHYKQTDCTCGRCLTLRADFHGSGHDSWSGKGNWKDVVDNLGKEVQIKDLESEIKVVEVKKLPS